MSETELSRLDEAELEPIKAMCQATFDVPDGRLLKTELGLGESDYVQGISPKEPIKLRLIGSAGNLETMTDLVTFTSHRDSPEIAEITYFLVSDTPEEFFRIIREGS